MIKKSIHDKMRCKMSDYKNIMNITKTMTKDEFLNTYNCNNLCPSVFNLKEPKTSEECQSIDCEECWENALKDVNKKG